ncbi:MAG TPA: hypothetical protein VK438_04580 [Xanthobacteraceae bacterium]|nr:hypothetical protein [Xanthobacteraceae bacterium]
MSPTGRGRPALLTLILILSLAGAASARAQEDNGFMPKGGKTLLLGLYGDAAHAAALREIMAARHDEAEWRSLMAARQQTLSDRELNELAAYLSVNTPVPDSALEQAAKSGDLAAALPADGRELAWTQCQFCHSLFSGYLMQQRDAQGWRSIFLSPFHRGIKLTAQERETFARYSAINMPLKPGDVPADLRY